MIELEKMDADLRQIHEASMTILEQTGMRFHHPEVVELLKANGIRVEGQDAFFTREQLLHWIAKAPSKFKLYARNPKYDIEVGGDNVEVCPGSGSPAMCEIDGTKRPSLMSDYINFLKLHHQCNHFNVNGGLLVQPNDVEHNTQAVALYATMLYTDKVIATLTGDTAEMEMLMEMLGIVFGGKEAIKEKPRAISIINTNTPLQLDTKMLETLKVFVEHGQPVVVAACSMAGTTAPVTLAGTIALTNAEVLAGIAVAQMMAPGAPVVYGSQTTTADMKTGSIAIGAPEGALCYEYAARLAKAYGLPCRGGGSLTDAKTLSVQAGYEAMLTLLATYGARTNLIFQSTGIMDSYNSMCYEKAIVDFEIIGMVKRYLDKVKVNAETLAVEVINQVGIAGEFLTSDHTMMNCRKEPFIPDLSLRGAVIGDADEKLIENIRKKKDNMLNSYQRPEFSEELHAKLVGFMVGKGVDEAVLKNL